MTKKNATLLWEDVIKNGKGENVIKDFDLNRKEVKVFLEYTKPEMFVSEEVNKSSVLEIKKLKQKSENVSKAIKKKETSSMIFNVMFTFYLVAVLPILALIIFIKYPF